MGNFSYKIITKDGKEKKGVIEAEDKVTAISTLKGEGNTVLSVEEGGSLNKQITFGKGKKVKARDLSVFCRQFNSLLRAGVSIIMSLDMLAEQTEHPTLKQSIYNVRDGVQKGDTLANSMKKENNTFPSILISMMEAGEQSGNVEIALERMAEHFEKDAKVKGALKKAMMYPIVLMCVALGVLVLMVVVVIPKFSSMFADMDAKLPGLTQALLNLSDALIHYWYIFILVIAGFVVGIKLFKNTKTGIYFFARLKIKLPAFGTLTVKTAAARFARTFSTMLASGMPMVEALTITAKTMDNQLFKDVVNDCAVQVQRGVSLTTPLKKSELFPALIIHMVGIGEESGNLEEMLNNCANYYDEEVEQATAQVMSLMEPMIILVLAGIVCLILGAIYGPMITMYNTLGAQ